MDEAVRTIIEEKIKTHPIVVFMKGTKNFPQCGFSASVVEVFKRLGTDIHDVNVLADPTIRQGIKDFSNWPTIPQVYIQGKFIGGRDIVVEMFEQNELQPLIDAAKAAK